MIYAIRAYFTPGLPKPPERSEAYKRWIRRFPCVVCSTYHNIEAAHTGDHGTSTKATDFNCLPMCPEHHRTGKYAYHKGRADWEAMHGKNVNELVEYFRGMWNRKQERKAA